MSNVLKLKFKGPVQTEKKPQGNLGLSPSRRKKRETVNYMPTDKDLHAIPRAGAGEYELNDKECARLRSRIYSLNKDNAAGFRWRTLREGHLLMVWRIR